MAASPVSIATSAISRRPRLVLTTRRLEANRRNAARSTGPRTPEGKARVARNAVKHGFFTAPARWSDEQHRDFATTLKGLREDFRPRDRIEDGYVATIAESYVRMAALWHYESIAAAKYSALTRASEPTLPGPREAAAICRYQGKLDRAIRDAAAYLHGRKHASLSNCEFAKTNPLRASREVAPRPGEGPPRSDSPASRWVKTKPLRASASSGPQALRRTSNPAPEPGENAKTNPLNPMFMGNRHQRRRAAALARRT